MRRTKTALLWGRFLTAKKDVQILQQKKRFVDFKYKQKSLIRSNRSVCRENRHRFNPFVDDPYRYQTEHWRYLQSSCSCKSQQRTNFSPFYDVIANTREHVYFLSAERLKLKQSFLKKRRSTALSLEWEGNLEVFLESVRINSFWNQRCASVISPSTPLLKRIQYKYATLMCLLAVRIYRGTEKE